jgi:uncharacterized protein (TIGR02145 family)
MKNDYSISVYTCMLMGALLFLNNSCSDDQSPSRLDPVITWAAPADITYGVKLSAKQLNATADAPGTLTYIPASGSKPDEGLNQELKVYFTPADVSKYNYANKTVKINVLPELTLSDIEGHVYKTVTIGSQVWSAENLRTTRYNDGSPIPEIIDGYDWEVTKSGAFCAYSNTSNPDSISTYGLLYNWYAVNTGKLAPAGWHIPSETEWNTLINYVANSFSTGARLKEAGIKHWLYPNTGANNETGFTALPAGYRLGHTSDYAFISTIGGFWSSTTDPTDNLMGWTYYLYYNNIRMDKGFSLKQNGYSVRCIMN